MYGHILDSEFFSVNFFDTLNYKLSCVPGFSCILAFEIFI